MEDYQYWIRDNRYARNTSEDSETDASQNQRKKTSFTPTTTTVPVTETDTVTLPEATVITTITAGAVAKRGGSYATPAVPFKSAIAAIKFDLISAGCSCIRTNIPFATSTATLTTTITQVSPTITPFSTVTGTVTTQTTTTVTVTLPGAPDASCRGGWLLRPRCVMQWPCQVHHQL
ncbi:hypothetical protein N0V86_002705 [Didymella sp. IMI 355093]|nr:hypothetical protein N0V86_002705 [Didymella sp. IMI 355093]